MQFLKILFGIALGFVLGLWAWINWQTVTIQLWGGLAADVNLPFLILIVFLIGFLPTFLLYRARIWSMRRKLENAERNVVMAQMAAAAASEPMPEEERVVVEGADQRVTGYSNTGTQ
jgi:putative membrane protein